jgi:hypothetical protein
MNAADRVIRWSTALAVLGVAAIAAVASYEHAYDLVRAHGETGWTARLVPVTVGGLIYASRVPSARAIRAELHVGQPGAQSPQAYLLTEAASRIQTPAT